MALLDDAEQLVRTTFSKDATGHDYWHVKRVQHLALRIAEEEGADTTIVALGALLHDMADKKLHDDPQQARHELEEWLASRTDEETREAVLGIVDRHSWSGHLRGDSPRTPEERAVFDADKLDAIGAIGIARAFATGAQRGRPLHNPDKPAEGTPGHFEEKLLKITEHLYTDTAKRLASHRHQFMQGFLEEFQAEWEGTR